MPGFPHPRRDDPRRKERVRDTRPRAWGTDRKGLFQGRGEKNFTTFHPVGKMEDDNLREKPRYLNENVHGVEGKKENAWEKTLEGGSHAYWSGTCAYGKVRPKTL